ncbi:MULTISPECIES: hypothetical protein [unclassified Bartonella]
MCVGGEVLSFWVGGQGNGNGGESCSMLEPVCVGRALEGAGATWEAA